MVRMSQLPLAFQERRLIVRRRVHIVALLHCHRLSRTVVIADCSHNGLRLVTTFAATIGERATVELLSGHRLPVQVMWVAGSHIGVRFFEKMQAGHPAMLAIREAVRKYESLDPPEDAA
jgi:PilZ domain